MIIRCAIVTILTIGLLPAAEHPTGLDPDKALSRLMTGNGRYVQHKEVHPDITMARRKELNAGQHPFAIILGCSDSRVPPELIFDQGLGDLFVIRDAGNVIDDQVLGSIEYAAEHLGTHLIMVLGHEKCGAVSATLAGGEAPGHIKAVVDTIRPSFELSKNEPGDQVHNCVVANARRVARQIRESEPILHELVMQGKLKVVAADYDIASGKVTLIK